MMATPALAHAIQIEAGTSQDLDSVMEVMTCAFGTRFGEAWTRSQLAGILPMAGVALNIACDSKSPETIGFSLFRTVAEESELLLIAVKPDRHREGIGRRLLDHFMDQAGACGVVRVHLEVRDGNPAIQMYREAGFAPVGRRRNYYHALDGSRFDALTFARKL
jgi:[ribosomal protein S18]-alanine N-acetyltransferase